MPNFGCLDRGKNSSKFEAFIRFHNMLISYGEWLLAPNLKDNLLFLRDYCINSYPPYLEAVSFSRNLRTRHAVVRKDLPRIAIITSL
jgi:hypothetical protein